MTGHLHILFAPLLPVYWLFIFSAAAFLFASIAIYRRARGAVGRILLLALLLLALANPSLIAEQREPLKDTALLVVDDSASMKLGTRTAMSSVATEALTQQLAKFPDLDVETLHVAGEDETDLFRAIEQKRALLPEGSLAGIIAITDGQIHDAPPANFSAPFHALIAGQKYEADRRIVIKSAPAYGIVGKKVTLTFRVEDEPRPQSDTASVTVTGDDGIQQTISAPINEDVKVDVPLNHAGANVAAFEVEALPNELTTINNTAAATINGIRDHLRVLLVSGEPQVGGREWRNLLKADPAVDLIHFTILRSPFKHDAVPNKDLALIGFPMREIFDTKLKDFDLIILDGFNHNAIIPDNYLANIAHYVEHGGALLIAVADGEQAASLSHSPLANLVPATSNGALLTGAFTPAITEAGQRHPVTATLQTAAPWGPWYRQADATVTNGDVLMTGLKDKPLLVLAHAGQGRVAQFLSNQFWLWARQYPNPGPEGELLRRTAHWLVGEPELDESALLAQAVRDGDAWRIAVSKQSLHETSVHVVITGPNQQPVQATLRAGKHAGRLEASIPVKEPGLYHIKDDAREMLVMVGATHAPEYGAMVATDKILQPVADAANGSVLWLEDTAPAPDIRRTDKNDSQHGSSWIGLVRSHQYRVTGSTALPLWPAWAALAVLLGLAMWVWRREGR